MKRNQSGFTLIEIAIVLVIIGLLLGGVLKGQELINSARVKNLATDFKNIPVFIYGYQDKYRALPGDDACAYTAPAAGSAPACATGHMDAPTANAVANGDGNGVISGAWTDTASGSEAYDFWQHVRQAGLAPGAIDPTGDYRPTNAAGGRIGLQSGTSTAANSPVLNSAGTPIRGSYIICSSGILGKFVKQLDIQMDDGVTDSGSMMAQTGTAPNTNATATADIDDALSYTVCMGV